jgi:hypothetical protein
MDRKRSEYTSSVFARSVLMASPNGMVVVVEVNDGCESRAAGHKPFAFAVCQPNYVI